MNFSRHGWRFGQTRCPISKALSSERWFLSIEIPGVTRQKSLTWLRMQRTDMVTSRLWLMGQRKSHTIWQRYIQHCDRSNVLTTVHTALRQEQCVHNVTYSTATGAMCSQLYIQHCDRSNVLTTLHTALRQEQCAVVRRVLQEQTKVETVKNRKPKEVIKEIGLIRPNNWK